MIIFLTLVVGAICGFIASQIWKDAGYGRGIEVAAGAIGGLIGAWAFGEIGIGGGVFISLITAIVGAALFIAAFQAARRAGLFAS